MLAVARVAICPGALDVSARGVDDPRHVVHLTVAVPHVHDGSGERFIDALLLTTYLDAGRSCLWRDELRPADGCYTVVQP